MNILSIDFGGSSVKYGVVDENAAIKESGRLPAPLASPEVFCETVKTLYNQYKGLIDGIGISIPGNVDPDSGVLSENGVYKQLYGKNVIRLVQETCGLPAAVENDGKCGALSEAWMGALRDCLDGAVLILGSAIAGGIIKNHRIHSGKWFNAGEFSYQVMCPGDYTKWGAAFMSVGMLGITYKLCKMKNLDLSIQDASPTLRMLDQTFASKFPASQQEPGRIRADGKQFFQWLEEDDKDAQKTYEEFIVTLGALVFNTQICYAPERIVIGGGISANERIVPDLRKELDRYYTGMGLGERVRAEVVRSRYLGEANLLGAAYNYFLHHEK